MLYKFIISLLVIPMALMGMCRYQETYHTKSLWTVFDVAQAIQEDCTDIDTHDSTIACFNGTIPLRNWGYDAHIHLINVLCDLLKTPKKEHAEYRDILDHIHGRLIKDPKKLPHVISKNGEIVRPGLTDNEKENINELLKKFPELVIPYEQSTMRASDLITTLYWQHHTERFIRNRAQLLCLAIRPTYISLPSIRPITKDDPFF